ncbi:hypothetical protein CRENBAI_016574 [Crenichthys baileyi]|uniref:Uncharacterized protein n=1 Tax=Crenichthys baileyi TaxID=28760 RepID=A0AAV9RLR9_9TELE
MSNSVEQCLYNTLASQRSWLKGQVGRRLRQVSCTAPKGKHYTGIIHKGSLINKGDVQSSEATGGSSHDGPCGIGVSVGALALRLPPFHDPGTPPTPDRKTTQHQVGKTPLDSWPGRSF